MSEAKSNIHTKLLAFQKLQVSIKKDANNPHFRSKYADLAEVISKVRPALNQVGIVLIQAPGETGLTTTLHDAESDTFITAFLPYIGATDAQKLGSNLTYLRRYSLVTMLGLEDDDDDGNKAVAPSPAVPAKAPVAPKPIITVEEAMKRLAEAPSVDELAKVWKALPKALREDVEVEAMKNERKEYLINLEPAD